MDNNDLVKNIQHAELNILKEVIPIFKKYNIKYAVYFGTLIGAIRHKGFIPWDDDVDIIMTRDDYEKFKNIASLELPDNLFVQDYYTDDEYPSPTAKIRNSSTTFIENGYRNLKNMNHGIWIDIFIVDKCSNNKFHKISRFFIRVLMKLIAERTKGGLIKKIIPKKFCADRTVNIAKFVSKHSKGDCYRIYSSTMSLISSDVFQDTIDVPFEDITVSIPKNYDIHLSRYGNYMEFPPPEERYPRHSTELISTTIGYKDFLANL